MEDFSVGSILSGIAASVIVSLFGYFFAKKRFNDKQSIKLKEAEIGGNVAQDLDDSDHLNESSQSIELERTIVLGDVTQTKKKL